MKKILSIVLAAIMVMALGVTAFAANDDGSHEARLYKDGQYNADSPDSNLSMGDGAIGNAVVTQSGSTYTIVIDLDEEFEAYGMSGSITAATSSDADVTSVSLLDTNNNDINDTLTIVVTSMSYPKTINLDFTITAWIMPVNSSGDLVIFE